MSIGSQALRLFGVALVVASASLLSLRPASASAFRAYHTWWYSDATFSTLVGEEYNNECTGEVWWWGVTTIYNRQTSLYCGKPIP